MLLKSRACVFNTVEKSWEKVKVLVTSIFSFSHDVFKSLFFSGSLKSGVCGKELISWRKKKCRKRENDVTSIFSFSHSSRIDKMTESSPNRQKTLLLTSNFSFSRSVICRFGELSVILSILKLSSANSFTFEECKICRFGKELNRRGCVVKSQVYNLWLTSPMSYH